MDFHSYETIIIIIIIIYYYYYYFIYMRNYYGMATEKRSGCGDLPGGAPPQASKKLSPPHQSPDPPLCLPRHHRHLVRAAGADSTAGMVNGLAPCG